MATADESLRYVRFLCVLSDRWALSLNLKRSVKMFAQIVLDLGVTHRFETPILQSKKSAPVALKPESREDAKVRLNSHICLLCVVRFFDLISSLEILLNVAGPCRIYLVEERTFYL